MSEEKTAGAEQATGKEAQNIDQYLEQHMKRWHERVQIIVAIAAVFLVFTIWFMLHD